jgi:hypothetical protein
MGYQLTYRGLREFPEEDLIHVKSQEQRKPEKPVGSAFQSAWPFQM